VSGSSPEDLAVAFRSFPRRLEQALAQAGGDASRSAKAHQLVPAVTKAFEDAAAALGLPTNDAAAIATRIESTPANQWNDDALERVRAAALAAGRAIRAVADAATD
jgi:hypothetical protein